MDDFFYLIDSGTKSNIAMFSDVKKMENALQTSVPVNISNSLLRFLYKMHTSIKINQIVDLPWKGIWDRYAIFPSSTSGTKWVVITNWSIRRFSLSCLKSLSENPQYRLVLIYLDTYLKVPDFYKKYINQVQFDLIYTFDNHDAEKYGWIFTNSLYSKSEMPNQQNIEYDLYFIGEDKGRADQLVTVYDYLSKNDLKCCFKIITTDTNRTSRDGLYFLKKRIEYRKILEDISKSRAILEIVQDGQSGMTMRPYEAMFYDKKLLTNNSVLRSMDFFNDKFMMVFSEMEDSVIQFLKNKEPVQYHYKNEYSPVKWLLKMPDDYQTKMGKTDGQKK